MLKTILKKIFYFMGSIRLAVPTMLTLALVVGIGTVIESRYNAEYARLLIYQNPWFSALLIMIWLNVLFAALTRLPWKKHHIGFLITHLGLLLLFGGGFLTNTFGVDGILRIPEGQSNKYVVLPSLVVSARKGSEQQGTDYPVSRTFRQRGESSFSDINEKLKGLAVIKGFQPFVEVREVLKEKPDTGAPLQEPFEIQFSIKSAMFGVVEQSLNSQNQRELKMGPATFRLFRAADSKQKVPARGAKSPKTGAQLGTPQRQPASAESAMPAATLKIKVGGVAKSVLVSHQPNQKIKVGKYQITIRSMMDHATVVNNGLQEQPGGPLNPAVVLEISDGGAPVKDVLYAKFPGFTLRKGQFPDLELALESAAIPVGSQEIVNHSGAGMESSGSKMETAGAGVTVPPAQAQPQEPVTSPLAHSGNPNSEPPPAVEAPASPTGPNGNEVRMFYSPKTAKVVAVELWKAGKKVTEKNVTEGETFQTPWMGMQLTVNKMAWNAEKEIQVVPTEPQEKADQLPPSAMKIGRYDGAPAEEVWMPEGDERRFNIDGKEYFVYFGRKVIELPFAVDLQDFKKIDYPGTSMAKSFESHVQVSGAFAPVTVSMNEPLYMKGYTVYQASYEQLPDGHFASIFSVNYDPGRPFKYLGGIILGLGIITYTLSKSRRAKQMGFGL